jgi:hypothetical protein
MGKQVGSINDILVNTYGAASGSVNVEGIDAYAPAYKVEAALREELSGLNEKEDRTPEEDELRDKMASAFEEINNLRIDLKNEGLSRDQIAELGEEVILGDDEEEGGILDSLLGKVAEIMAPSEEEAQEESIDNLLKTDTLAQDALNYTTKQEIESAALPEDSDEAATVIRAAYQCFLLYNLPFFSKFHKNLLTRGKDNTAYEPTENGNIMTPGYYSAGHTRMHLVDESNIGTTVLNKLQICPGNNAITEIKPHEVAQLMPLLRIYKVYRNHKGTGVTRVVEMEFANATNLDGIATQLTVDSPLGSGQDTMYARGTASGVRSFDWRFVGSDPFRATRAITATMVLTFQHFSSLVKERTGPDLSAGGNSENIAYKYLDLIVQPDCRQAAKDPSGVDEPPKYAEQPYTRFYRPECFEVRVDVGYHYLGPTADMSENLKNFICCQRQTLYLTPTSKSFDFKQDGTFDLTIQFQSRLETAMKDQKFNVLMPGGGFSEVYFWGSETLEENSPSIEYGILAVEQELANQKEKPDDKKDLERIKLLERNKEYFFVQAKQFFYTNLFQTLMTKNAVHKFVLKEEEYKDFIGWQASRSIHTLPPRLALGSFIDTVRAEEGLSTGAVDATIAKQEDDDDPGEAQTEQINNRIASAVADQDRTVNYIFLGDLLASVTALTLGYAEDLTAIAEGQAGLVQTIIKGTKYLEEWGIPDGTIITNKPAREIAQRMRMILGTLDLEFADMPSEKHIVNIAHIPISLDVFQEFMIKNVLSKGASFYSYFAFIDNVLSDLVINLLGGECFGGIIQASAKSRTGVIANPRMINEALIGPGLPVGGEESFNTLHLERVNPDDASTLAFEACGQLAHEEPFEYLVIDSNSIVPDAMVGTLHPGTRGDEIGDLRRGIHHFHFGADRGLLKTIQFQKQDQAYLPEARMAAEGDFVFNQLSNVFNINMVMIGNTLFNPGQYVYFDAASIGAGNSYDYQTDGEGTVSGRSWANLMGIGGYHLVTEVFSSITKGKFETTVKARWETGGTAAPLLRS